MVEWTIIKILTWTESYFKKHSQEHPSEKNNGSIPKPVIDSPRLTAEILLAHILGIRRLDLYLQHDRPLEQKELADFKACIKRRIAGEPVAYITGTKGFYESDFQVSPGVLIPRPDTETLVEAAIKVLSEASGTRVPAYSGDNRAKKILELGVGSGAVIISLAKAVPGQIYVAGDLSLNALDTARKNAGQLLKDPVLFFAGEWMSAVADHPQLDLILSNPPYIPSGDIAGLAPEINRFEPRLALDGGPDGLDAYRVILEHASHSLVPGGVLLLEMGYDQKNGIELIFKACPSYESIEFIKDLAGHDRVVKIVKMKKPDKKLID